MSEEKRVEEWINRANRAFASGDYETAIERYSRALNIAPNSIRALIGRGDAWIEKGEYAQAFSDYNRTFRLNPRYPDIVHKRNFAMALQSSERERQELEQRLDEERKTTSARLEREFKKRLDRELKERLKIQREELGKHLEAEREATTKRLENEYREKLEKELLATVERITEGPKRLHKEAFDNMEESKKFRTWTMMLACAIPFWVLFVYLVLLQGFLIDRTEEPFPFFWLFLAATSSSPFFLLIWLFLRWRYEAKTLAYGFACKAIVEERINSYFYDDPEQFKKMLENYVANWGKKSPLEIMLTIGGKRKKASGGGSDFPAEALLEKITKLIETTKSSTKG